MKALSVRQPYASLIAAGIKTVITRPRPVGYRGRVAIHAAARRPAPLWHDANDHPHPFVDPYVMDPCWRWDENINEPGSGRYTWVGPLGAVVASAVITDCVPIIDGDADQDDGVPYPRIESCLMDDFPDGWLDLWHPEMGNPIDPNGSGLAIPQQAPYGDFSPGRWALLLDDIAPTTSRCPQCWGDPVYHGLGCDLCDGKGTCDPVPARGRSGMWEWTR